MQESGGKKSKHCVPVAFAQAQARRDQFQPVAFSKAKVNLTGSQMAWESPLVPLLGDVGVYGFLRETGSIAVGLATGPL